MVVATWAGGTEQVTGSKPHSFMTECNMYKKTHCSTKSRLDKVAHTCEPSIPKVQAKRQTGAQGYTAWATWEQGLNQTNPNQAFLNQTLTPRASEQP